MIAALQGAAALLVAAGKFKGKRLCAPRGRGVRPTRAMVRQALFNIIGDRIEGAAFLDLFAGTGAVGIEALSRGAGECVFVEEKREALAALQENLASVGAGREARVLPLKASKALDLLGSEGFAPDILFADPPYASEEWPLLLKSLASFGVLAPKGLIVVEHASKSPPAPPLGMDLLKRYRYGDTGLTVFAVGE